MAKKQPYNEQAIAQLTLAIDNTGKHKEKVLHIQRDKEADSFNRLLAGNIRAARIFSRKTQIDLAEKIYGSKELKSRICEFESGAVIPSTYMLLQIAKATNCSVDFMLGLSSEPVCDEYSARQGLATAIIHDSLKPIVDQLATLTAKTVGKIPTSPAIKLIEKTKNIKRYLNNIRQFTNFEKDIAGSQNLIAAIEECITLADKMEREVQFNMLQMERAAQDALLHDEKRNGHLFDWESMVVDTLGKDKYLSKYDTGKLAQRLGNSPEADGDGQKYKWTR